MAATIEERVTRLEKGLLQRPVTYEVADSLMNTQDRILNRLAALEDVLLAPDNQPTADQLSTVILLAEYEAWQRVNPGAGVIDWTIHFARTRGLGVVA